MNSQKGSHTLNLTLDDAMKNSSFKWAYNSELNLRNDSVMTRERLASMVRSWRNDKHIKVTRKATKGKTLFIVRSGGLLAFSEVTQ